MHARKDLHKPSNHSAILGRNQVDYTPYIEQLTTTFRSIHFLGKHHSYAMIQRYVKCLNFTSTQHVYKSTHLGRLGQRSLGNCCCILFYQKQFWPEWDRISWRLSSKACTGMRWKSKLLGYCCCIHFFYRKHFDLSGIKTPGDSHAESIQECTLNRI